MIICIDFDGTIVEHEYPSIGKPVPGAIETMASLIRNGHRIVLFTMRSGEKLQEAVDYINSQGVDLYGVNKNPTQTNWTDSPKAYGHLYIDDAALGCPLVVPSVGRPFVDWSGVKSYFVNEGLLLE